MHDPAQNAVILVNARAAALRLSISPRKLWSITSPRGGLRATRIGSLVRYSVDELHRYAKSQQDCAEERGDVR